MISFVLLLNGDTLVNTFQMFLLLIGDSAGNSQRVCLVPPETELAPLLVQLPELG